MAQAAGQGRARTRAIIKAVGLAEPHGEDEDAAKAGRD